MQREGVNMRFFSGDGVVKNVPHDKPAVFEVWIKQAFVIFLFLISCTT